MILYTKGTL